MELDEAGTLAALKMRRRDVLAPIVEVHHGRIVKVMGDGLLLEFASAVDAVQCAVELQKSFASANEADPEERHIVLRIGINLGDVIVEGSDIYGDGVNIAARLEGIAPAGRISVSSTVRDHVIKKLKLQFEDMGEQTLKNIATPIHVWLVASSNGSDDVTSRVGSSGAKPSIAVLPFVNLSGDPDQEYFADGLTEDIITELARFSTLTVIARNSSFQYRDRSQDMKKVGRELGVRYLVEGSVRKLGSNVRITAQLIDASTGNHIWAERYDRGLEELFAVQDEVIRSIVTTTEHRLTDAEIDQATRRPPSSWAAHDFYLQARRFLNNYETYDKVEAPLLRAIELDPSMAEAHAKMAHFRIAQYWNTLDESFIDAAEASARKALSINSGSCDAHTAISIVYAFQDRMDKAILHAKRSLALNPNDTLAATNLAQWIIYSGKFADGLVESERILERDPIPPTWYWDTRGSALFQLKRYQEVIDSYAMVEKHQVWEMAYLAASNALMDRMDDARAHIASMLAVAPTMTISKMLKYERYQTADARNHFAEGLRKAGLPK
jgi:TolB-like protein/Tfp pilus assembly protein PilF